MARGYDITRLILLKISELGSRHNAQPDICHPS